MYISFILGMGTNILLQPKSRIAPVDTEVDYYCKISNGVNPHWVINDIALEHENVLTSQGFLFEKVDSMSLTTLTLKVHVTADKNGTEVYCSSLDTHSDIALLITISGNSFHVLLNKLNVFLSSRTTIVTKSIH